MYNSIYGCETKKLTKSLKKKLSHTMEKATLEMTTKINHEEMKEDQYLLENKDKKYSNKARKMEVRT